MADASGSRFVGCQEGWEVFQKRKCIDGWSRARSENLGELFLGVVQRLDFGCIVT